MTGSVRSMIGDGSYPTYEAGRIVREGANTGSTGFGQSSLSCTHSVWTPNHSVLAAVRVCNYGGFGMSGDEIVRVEKFKIERFMALGLGRYQAIRAVEDALDWHRVEALLKTECTLAVALESR
jgi:hypothetical protein